MVNKQDCLFEIDGYLGKKMGDSWTYEGNVGTTREVQYQGWSDNYISNAFTYHTKSWYYADAGLDLHETVDPLDKDVREVRPRLGQGFILPKYFKRVHLDKPYFYMKFGQRFLWYPEEEAYDAKNRLRLRLGGKFSLTKIHFKAGEEDAFYLQGTKDIAGDVADELVSTLNAAVKFTLQ